MENIEYGWLIYEVSENDYRLGADGLDIEITKRPPADNKIIEYNQLDLPNGQNSCTIHASCGAVSDLTDIPYSLKERQALWDSALALDASETQWWYFYKAVDHIRKDWNKKNPDDKLVSFRISYWQKEFDLALSRWHSLVWGFKGNAVYNTDASDGNLEWTSFGKSTYGHCIRIRKDKWVFVVDNYKGKKLHNTYMISDFKALIENKVFFDEFYLFLSLKTMNEDEQLLVEAKQLWLWNGERPNDPITRREAVLLVMRAKKSTK